jgi:hypothetical protein
MFMKTLWLGLLMTLAVSCARPPDTLELSRFNTVAATLHHDAALTRLERQQVLSDLRIALAQRNAFGRVLSVTPSGNPAGVLLVDLRLFDIKRLANRIDVTAQVDLVNMASGDRLHSFSLGVSGSRGGDLGTLSIGVISDLVEQIADVLSRPALL